ncbi:hypothetical protein DICPUDRAFT_148793, partial [Dictyostelium purpureum]
DFHELTLLDKPISLHLIPHPCVKYKKIVDNKEIIHKGNYKSFFSKVKRTNINDSLNGNHKKKIKTSQDDIMFEKKDNIINNTDIDINNNNNKNSSSITVIKETQPFKLIKKKNTNEIAIYLFKGIKALYQLLFSYPKGVTSPSNFFSRLVKSFKYTDSGLINQKIDEYLISNNNNHKITKLLSIFIFSHLNILVKKGVSPIQDIKEIYKKILTKVNNREHIKSIHSFYKRTNNKDKYTSIYSDIIDCLKFVDQSVEIEIRTYNFFSYQLQYSTQITSNRNDKNIKTIKIFLNQKYNTNNNYNNPYNSNEIIKVYDQEVFNDSFCSKPDQYCNKNIFKSDFGNNPEDLKYKCIFFKNNFFFHPPQNGNYSISPSLELFKLCFGVFSSGLFKNFDWGEETDETRVIVSGGSISACIDTLPITIKKEFIRYKTIERYLYKLKMPELLVRKFMEFVFEDSLLKELLFERFFSPNSPTFDSDVDVWFIGQDLNSAKKKLYQTIENIKSNFRKANPLSENSFFYVQTPNALTFFGTYPQRKIQFITKIYNSVDHLLSTFDMDCVRVFYDGSNVFMHRESIDSYNKRQNIASPFSKPHNNRLEKYLLRGFNTYIQNNTSSYKEFDSHSFHNESLKEGLDIAQMKDFFAEKFGSESVSNDPYNLLEFNEISFKEKLEISQRVSIECKACRSQFIGSYKKFCSLYGKRCSGFYNLAGTNVDLVREITPFKYSLVLGGRTGLGFQIAFYLLDLGFTVFITSRFPEITKNKFSQQNFSPHLKKLHIIKVDFNDTVQTEHFIKYIKKKIPQLDLFFNTIKFSNKNINNNYSSIFNQLKNQEESLTTNKSTDYNPNQQNEFQIKIIHISNKNINYKYDFEIDQSTSTTNQIINNSMELTNEFVNYLHYKFPKLIVRQLIPIIKNQKKKNDYYLENHTGFYPRSTDSFLETGIIFNINWKEGDIIDSDIKNFEEDILYLKYPVTDKDLKKCYIKREENLLVLKTSSILVSAYCYYVMCSLCE